METSWKQRSRARNRARLLLILLLGVVLRAATLFSVELDRDEIWSMRQSRVNLTVELNHTFHLALVAPFTRSLPDVVGIRIVSFWAGLIAIAASARLGYRLGGWTVALWTALLVALSPYLIAYSQEGRDYMLCVALTTLGLAMWLESRPWLSMILLLGGILAVSSTVFVVPAIDAATLIALLRRNQPDPLARWQLPSRFSARTWLISHGLLYATTLAFNWLVARSPAGAYLPIVNNEAVSKFIYRYLGVMQCGDGGSELLPCLSLGVILWLALIVGVIVLLRRNRLGYRGLLMLMIVIVPLLAVTGLQAINYGIFIHRHLLMTLPALFGLWGIVLLAWRRWSPVLGILLVAQALLALVPYYQANPYKPNWQQIVAYVDSHRQSSEPVVTAPVLLDMLVDEAGYHFNESVTSKVPAAGSFWFISLNPDDEPPGCVHVPDAGERQVYLFYCKASTSK